MGSRSLRSFGVWFLSLGVIMSRLPVPTVPASIFPRGVSLWGVPRRGAPPASQPWKDRLPPSPGDPVESPRQDSDWPDLDHMIALKPITAAWDVGSSDGPGLGHVGSHDRRRHVLPWTVCRDLVGNPQQKADGGLLGTRNKARDATTTGLFSLLGLARVSGQGPRSSRCALTGTPCPPPAAVALDQSGRTPATRAADCRGNAGTASTPRPGAHSLHPGSLLVQPAPAGQMPPPRAGAPGWPRRALPCSPWVPGALQVQGGDGAHA